MRYQSRDFAGMAATLRIVQTTAHGRRSSVVYRCRHRPNSRNKTLDRYRGQVSKVQTLLNNEPEHERNGWRAQQEAVLQILQSGNLQRLRLWIKERSHDYPAETLITHLFIPLRRRLQSQQPALTVMLSLLDGVLINYICGCLNTARKKNGRDALVVGWNVQDTTRIWLEGWMASQQGWRVDVLAHSLSYLRPEMFEGQTLLVVWRGPSSSQQKQMHDWQQNGHAIFPLGI
jgi:hypothetical protein